jgi:hypothetical protein
VMSPSGPRVKRHGPRFETIRSGCSGIPAP